MWTDDILIVHLVWSSRWFCLFSRCFYALYFLPTCRSSWRRPASSPAWRSPQFPRRSSTWRSSAAACPSRHSKVRCRCGWCVPSPSWSCSRRTPVSPSVPGWHLWGWRGHFYIFFHVFFLLILRVEQFVCLGVRRVLHRLDFLFDLVGRVEAGAA